MADHPQTIYFILFAIVFCETGLVVTPILPGDSMLFAAGVVASMGKLNPLHLFLVLGGGDAGRHGQLLGWALHRPPSL